MHTRRPSALLFVLALIGAIACGGVAELPDQSGPTTDATSPVADTSSPLTDTSSHLDIPTPDVQTKLPDVKLEPQPLGGICSKDVDCIDGWCNTSYSGGYCSTKCTLDDECPAGGKCFDDSLSNTKMCWKTCETYWDCRGDQFCAELCIPDCQFDTCNTGYECDGLTGQCIKIGSVPCEPVDEVCNGEDDDCDKIVDEGCGNAPLETEGVLVNDLGLVDAGGGGLSKTLSVNISTAAKSFMILITSADGSSDILSLWSLTSPAGSELVIGSDPYNSPIRLSPNLGVSAVLVPNTPAVQVEGGLYKFAIYKSGDAGKVWVSVVQVIRPQVSASKMDVNFWFVGLGSLFASKAKKNNKFQSLVSYFTGLLQEHGVTVKTINYYDVDPAIAPKYAIVDTSKDFEVDEHAELLALSGSLPADNRGVNFFFVKGFTGWGLLGKAGGIPGPNMHGTYGSGVVVSLADYFDPQFNDGVGLTAHAMAHELGHQLGLFHTSEQDGSMFDPIADTPKCANDFNDDGMIDFQECIGKGNTNLMFWLAHIDNVLSAGQKHVIHRNPALYD